MTSQWHLTTDKQPELGRWCVGTRNEWWSSALSPYFIFQMHELIDLDKIKAWMEIPDESALY